MPADSETAESDESESTTRVDATLAESKESKHSGVSTDEELTDSTSTRWEYWGTIAAASVFTVFLILVLGAAFGMATLTALPQAWFALLASLVLTAAVWTFGKEALTRLGGGN